MHHRGFSYPVYPTQRMNGDLPGVTQQGPSDLMPSGSTAPYYQARIDRMYGRHIAGLGEVQDTDTVPGTALNELKLMAEQDDAFGNGVFEAPRLRQNYTDAGVFAGKLNVPGYIEREQLWTETEVLDATTGAPLVVVPGGAVAMNDRERLAHTVTHTMSVGRPLLSVHASGQMPFKSTVNTQVAPMAVSTSGLGGETGIPGKAWLLAAIAAAAGVGILMLGRKPMQPNVTARKRPMEFWYAGPIEVPTKGKRPGYRWADGYTTSGPGGGAVQPWMTRQQAREYARKQGYVAKFIDD